MLPGDKINRLTFVRDVPSTQRPIRHRKGVFLCDCGQTTRPIRVSHVSSGAQKSCGCIRAAQPRGTCIVDGCEGRIWYLKGGLCVAHYKRHYKYGDPHAGGIRHGAAQRFIAAAIASETDDCILFPYSHDGNGYGKANIAGKRRHVHPYVLERRMGPKPSKRHECCHSCGNGHLGCINPRHLYWGTRSDNVQDAVRHGTAWRGGSGRGENHPQAKLNRATVALIRQRLSEGVQQVKVAIEFGISQTRVSAIKRGEAWPL